jgi:YqaJ-like viral recombinase domain
MSTAGGRSPSRPAVAKKVRRYFIGGSDARIIMGNDEQGLIQLWREKRGEVEPEDLSGNLAVQLGIATEELNRRWYEASTRQVVIDIQKRVRHPALRWMGATLDSRCRAAMRCSRPSSCYPGRSRKMPVPHMPARNVLHSNNRRRGPVCPLNVGD